MATERKVFICVQEKSIGFAAGDTAEIELHLSGINGQEVLVSVIIYDPLGAVWYSSHGFKEVSEGTVLSYPCAVRSGDPAGRYQVAVSIYSEEENWRLLETDEFQVVLPGTTHPGMLPVVVRDRVLPSPYVLREVDREALVELLEKAHESSLENHNEDGSWGKGKPGDYMVDGGGHPQIRSVGDTTVGYVYAYEASGGDTYKEMALGGLDYLVKEQEPNGQWRWWGSVEGVVNNSHCFYDTGWAGLALMEGYRVFGDSRYLETAKRAGDWALGCPYTGFTRAHMPDGLLSQIYLKKPTYEFTGNNNFDAFAMWYLAPLYQVTGESKYLEGAVDRMEGAVLSGQLPYGGWPGHNFAVGYHTILCDGLTVLYEALPSDHPFKAKLGRRVCMALNFLLYLQDSSGNFYQCWEYDREFMIDGQGRPVGRMAGTRTSMIQAFYVAWRVFGLDRWIFTGLAQSALKGSSISAAAVLLKWFDDLEKGDPSTFFSGPGTGHRKENTG